jgi:hypothetical protein
LSKTPRYCSSINPAKPAGRVLELKATDQGLLVRALVTHEEAKRCSGFSIAATIHNFRIVNSDDRNSVHGLITDCTLDEVTLATHMANAEAVITKRYRPGPFDHYLMKLNAYAAAQSQFYTLSADAFRKATQIVETLAQLRDSRAAPGAASPEVRSKNAPEAARIYGRVPARPRTSDFGRLAARLQERT